MTANGGGGGRGAPARRLACWALALALAVGVLAAGEVPPAGTRIANVAEATFVFAGRTYRVTSNEAAVYVLPVYGISITPSGTEGAPGMAGQFAPGSTASFAYTLCNTGNTDDRYELTATVVDGDFTPDNVRIFWDRNGNGVRDPGEPEVFNTSPLLAMGECIQLIVVYDIPLDTEQGDELFVNLAGTSRGDPDQADTDNVHKSEVNVGAVLDLTKSATPSEASRGSTVTWKLVGRSIGAREAGEVTVEVDDDDKQGVFVSDPIAGYANGIRYVGGSLGGLPLGTPLFSTDGGFSWTEDEPDDADSVNAVGYLFPAMEPGQEFALTYQVTAEHPAGLLLNVAEVSYLDGTDEVTQEARGSLRILAARQPAIGPWEYPLGDAPGDAPDYISPVTEHTVSRGGDISTIERAYVGEPAGFLNTIRNTGNTPQTINVSLDPSSNIPDNWAVVFSWPGGGTLTDTSGDGIPDVGRLQPGEEVTIRVEVYVHPDAEYGDNDGAYWNTVVRAASAADSAAYDTTIDRIREVMGFWDLVKEVDRDTARYGDLLTYTLTFENVSDVDIEDGVLTDRLDAGLQRPEFITQGKVENQNGPESIYVTATYNATEHEITWVLLDDLPPGFKGELTFRSRVVPKEKQVFITDPVLLVRNWFSANGIAANRQVFRISNGVLTLVGVETFLRIDKRVDRRRIEFGDAVTFSLDLHNHHPDLPAVDLTVRDFLPVGFRYVEGTSRLDGAQYTDPAVSADGRTLEWAVDAIAARGKRTLTFQAVATPSTPEGEAVNLGYVKGYYDVVDKVTGLEHRLMAADGPATVSLRVGGGFLGDRSILIGRVFVDENRNGRHDHGESGVAGVRLVMEDGSFAVTDKHGMYHLVGLRPGLHVVRLDPGTLPAGYTASTIVVPVYAYPGGPVLRADFPVRGAPPVPEEPAVEQVEAPGVPDFPATTAGQHILFPAEGTVFVRRDRISVLAETGVSDSVDLYVNGDLVSRDQIGTRMYDPTSRRARFVWVSVPLRPGRNILQIAGQSPQGVTFRVQREVYLSGRAARLQIDYDRGAALADAVSELQLTVRAVDAQGRPAATGAFVTVEVRGADIATPDANPHARGHQVLLGEDGAVFRLAPVDLPRAVTVVATSGDLRAEVTISFSPPLRDWIWAGVGEITLGIPLSTSGDWEPQVPGTLQTASLSRFSGAYWLDGRFAVWGQGRSGNLGVMTLAFDSAYPLLGPPDGPRYPRVWNDAASLGRSAQSAWRGFARLDMLDGSHAVVGNFTVDLSDPLLYSFRRTFTGLSVELRPGDLVGVDLFTTLTDQAWVRDTLLGRGDFGPYTLSEAPVKHGSEHLRWIAGRDERKLTRGVDYWIDYNRGQVYFAESVPVVDDEGRTVHVVARYEVEARAFAQDSFPVTGCILGPYALSTTPVMPASERVFVEVRDPVSGALVDEFELNPTFDYTLSYSDGMLLLADPLCPTDAQGNEHVIRVTYRAHAADPKFPVLGGRLRGQGGGLSWDVSFLYQGSGGELPPLSLVGGGLTWREDDLVLTVRTAINTEVLAGGRAWAAQLAMPMLPGLNVEASYRYVGPGFVRPDAPPPEDYGSAPQGHTFELRSRGDLGFVRHRGAARWDLEAGRWDGNTHLTVPLGSMDGLVGLEWRAGNDALAAVMLGAEATLSGVRSKVWTRYAPVGDWWELGVEGEGHGVGLKLAHRTDTATDQEELRYGVSLDLGHGFGANLSQRVRTAGEETSTLVEWGLSANFELADSLGLSLSYDAAHPDPGVDMHRMRIGARWSLGGGDVVSASMNWGSAEPLLQGLEIRVVNTSPRDYDIWALLTAGGEEAAGRLDVAWRPVDWSGLAVFGQLELETRSWGYALAGSVEGVWLPIQGTELAARWGLRQASYTGAGGKTGTGTTLIGLRALWEIPGTPFEIGGHGGIGAEVTTGVAERYLGVLVRTPVVGDLAVALGFNLNGLSDADYPAAAYTYAGPFLRLEATTGGGWPWR